MKLMTAIITLDRLQYNNNFENDFCKKELDIVDHKSNETTKRFKEITYAIFQAKNIKTGILMYSYFLCIRTL